MSCRSHPPLTFPNKDVPDKSAVSKMHSELQQALASVREKRAFDAKLWIDKKTDLFNEYMTKCGLKACVVSVSGGVDSAVTLGLMKAASKKSGSPIQRVVGIAQPIHSTPSIQNRAYEVGKALDAEMITVDQSEQHLRLVELCDKAIGINGEGFSKGQLRSYMRTPVNFYISQLISQSGLPCIVMGTGNMDEDGYLLYFCKAGDGVADVQLIADLHKSEVFTVGRELGVPESILVAPPSADLWDGQTDEDELGFSYDFIELYTSYLKMSDSDKEALTTSFSAEALDEFKTCGKKADSVNRRNGHKANFPHNINCL